LVPELAQSTIVIGGLQLEYGLVSVGRQNETGTPIGELKQLVGQRQGLHAATFTLKTTLVKIPITN